jgi:hypothetical protein
MVSGPEKLLSLSCLSAELNLGWWEDSQAADFRLYLGSCPVCWRLRFMTMLPVLSCERPMTSFMPLRDILWNAPFQRPRDDRLEEAVTGTDADASPRSVSPARGTVVAAAWG